MPPSTPTYAPAPGTPTHAVKEQQIEYGFIGKLQGLKYEYRDDIRDRAALERNFREKFEALNRVHLTDGEFARLLDEIVTPDVFTAAKTLRSINSFTREDGTPLNYTLVNIKDWCKNTFEVVNQLRINTDNSHHRFDVLILINGVPCVQVLSDDYADKVIVTTIQKLGLALDENSKRNKQQKKDGKATYKEQLAPLANKRIVFIFDECHRSQFGDNHQAIKEFFPKAQLFGFTGTPIFEANSSRTQIEDEQASMKTTEDLFQKQLHAYQFREEEARYSRRVEMAEIEKNDFNLNISRYISTAVGEAEIDLEKTHRELVAIEEAIAAAKQKHNGFLRQLGLKLLP